MSASLLKKSLKLFDEKKITETSNKSGKRHRSAKTSAAASNSTKQPTFKDKKIKSALEAFVQKNPKQDKTLENLAILTKLTQKKHLSQESANKIISYHLKKSHKVVEAEQKKKKETSVFTEEDFLKFEQEYFVKS